jgi:ABC-2 type transport system ATP-binding protein
MSAIKTEGMSKYYGKTKGVENLDLEVAHGEFFGFIGPNGAGKSTTIRALLGLISLTEGRAEVLGMDVSKHSTEILREVGYLPSQTSFWHGMRVSEVLELSARLRKKDCDAESKLLCERLELDRSRKVSELSLGNKKKVGIVAALQHSPSLYVLDEPTSGLDPLMQKEFYEILKERNERGATVFLSSHVLSEVGKYCKRAAIISAGRLLAADTVDNLAHTGVKRVTLRGVATTELDPDFKDVRLEGENISFLFEGKSELLISKLAGMRFEDVNISDPDLEEVFMHYYTRKEL